MSSAPSASMPTPERIFDVINAYQQSEALKAAIRGNASNWFD